MAIPLDTRRRNIILLIIFIFIVGRYAVIYYATSENRTADTPSPQGESIHQAYKRQLSKIQVQGAAQIVAILPDDTDGARHQRFIIQISPHHTVLVTHNIDIAPRVTNLTKGEEITFSGEYIWNEKGGILHWTHHDPQRHHANGWLRYQGNLYQ